MATTKRQQREAAQVLPKDRTPAQRKIVAETRNVGVRNEAGKSDKQQQSGRK